MPRERAVVLLYPGCIFLEIAATVELLAEHCEVGYFTPTGEVHFRIGCDDDSDPALLHHIASEIERTGLGRTVTC